MKFRYFVLFTVLLCAVCTCALADYTVPANTTVIEEEAFMNNSGMSHVTLPDGLLRIESKAFYNCGLSTVYLPSSLTYIADNAFDGNSNMKVVTQPGTNVYNWAKNKGFIKNEPAIAFSSYDITVVSNSFKTITLAALAPEEFISFGIEIDGEALYSIPALPDFDTYSRFNGPIYGGAHTVGDHLLQAFIVDKKGTKTYVDTAVLHITQGPAVNMDLDINTHSIILGVNEEKEISYSITAQNVGIKYVSAYFFADSTSYNLLFQDCGAKNKVNGTFTIRADDFPADGEYSITFDVFATNGLTKNEFISVHVGNPSPGHVSTHAWLTDCYFVSWDSMPNATGYRVYYSTTGTVTKNSPYREYDANTTSVNFNTTPGEKNYFAVTALYADGESDLSAVVTGDIVTPLPKPASFVLDSVDANGNAQVHWSAVNGTNNYRIYYSRNADFSGFLPCVLVDNSTSYLISLNDLLGVSSGDTVYLWAAAETEYGPGVPSSRLTVQIPLPETNLAPPGVSTYAWLTDCYSVSWDSMPNATGYRVYYSTTGTVTKNSPYREYDANTTSVNFNTTPGEKNYFAVTALYADGESDLSAVVTDDIVTPLPKPASFVLDSVDANGNAQVHWSAVNGTNNYRVYYSLYADFSGFLPCTLVDNSTSFFMNLNDLLGVSSGDTVYLWAAAQTDEGPGVPSARLTVSIPSKPVLTVSTGNNSVDVTAGNETMCKFVAPSAGTYIFKTTGPNDTMGVLYDASMSQIADNDDVGDDRNFMIECTLDLGNLVSHKHPKQESQINQRSSKRCSFLSMV